MLNQSNIEDPIRIDKVKAKSGSGLSLVDDNDSGILIKSNEIRVGFRDPTFTDIDFTDPAWTEEDPGDAYLTIIANKVSWTALPLNVNSWVVYDYTADYFDGDFRHELECIQTAADDTAQVFVWMLANTIDDGKGIADGSGDYLSVLFYDVAGTQRIYVEECDGGASHSIAVDVTEGEPYYLTIVRDESVGTYGTLYCYIYIDADRTILFHKLEMALHTSKKDFQYLYSCNSWNTGAGATTTGFTQNLRLSTDPFGVEKGIYVHDDGTVDMEMQSGCRVWGGQTVSTGGWEIMELNNENWDHQNEFNITTYRFTAKKGGKHAFTVQTKFTTAAGAYIYQIKIDKNGAIMAAGDITQEENNDKANPQVSGIVALDPNDYLEVYVGQDTGIDRATNDAQEYSFFTVQKVA